MDCCGCACPCLLLAALLLPCLCLYRLSLTFRCQMHLMLFPVLLFFLLLCMNCQQWGLKLCMLLMQLSDMLWHIVCLMLLA